MELKGNGKEYYRSLEQLAETDEFKQFLHREFPKGTGELAGDNHWSRRSFLTTMGASLALAGLTGCRRPVEKIVPYVTRPEEVEPGVPNKYATTMPLGLSACGVVVTTHEGRPTFIEGNELHPSSRGAVNPIVQASLLDLYDPDRSRGVVHKGRESSWDDFVTWWQEQHAKYADNGGEGLAVLSETFHSPTLARLKRRFEETFPKATWTVWEPVSDENIYRGLETVTGTVMRPVYDFSKARIALALDCDFLGTESESIANTRGFSEARRVRSQTDTMNRLYAVEPSMTVTGMMADHRLRVGPFEVANFLAALLGKLAESDGRFRWFQSRAQLKTDIDAGLLSAVAEDLLAQSSRALVVAGRRQPAAVHAAVAAINESLGAVGRTVRYTSLQDAALSRTADLRQLDRAVSTDQVETLFVLGGNPAYESGSMPGLGDLHTRVRNTVHFGDHLDETGSVTSWHIPKAHYLEGWGDVVAADGTPSVVQPIIHPLHHGKSPVELLGLLAEGTPLSGHDTVRETWREIWGRQDSEERWRKLLHDGLEVPAEENRPRYNMQSRSVAPNLARVQFFDPPMEGEVEVCFHPSTLFDGRLANNGWLQELPDPVTKLTWDNAALISPQLAEARGLNNEDVVELTLDGRTLEIPVWISPGQADRTMSLALGYGRTAVGRVGNGVGSNTYRLRFLDRPWSATGVKIRKTGATQELACTQDHGSMEGRPIIRENTLAGYREKAEFFPLEIEHPALESLWDEHKYDEGYQWGMSIDLNACTGCNACVVACQSENNIPVIGKEQVREGREMHWMRIDRYYAGDIGDPEVAVQPMNCQHCEMAPCEQVCPVAATSHDDEGLNVMTYNRCIGTRYCSNNCPYKVRRFNFFNYTNDLPETVQMAQNPEVTVRFRGVMEKCTYCVQRIAVGKINAKNDGRTVADGEIKTACESACPAKAIVFGNINDPDSEVSKLKKNNRKYRVLEELNTRPRTSYMAKLRNPSPALHEAPDSSEEKHG